MASKEPVIIDQDSGEVETLPAAKRCRAKLDTVVGVRQEQALIYREARTGKLETSDLTKLMYCLNIIRQTIESGEIEVRLDALENGDL